MYWNSNCNKKTVWKVYITFKFLNNSVKKWHKLAKQIKLKGYEEPKRLEQKLVLESYAFFLIKNEIFYYLAKNFYSLLYLI